MILGFQALFIEVAAKIGNDHNYEILRYRTDVMHSDKQCWCWRWYLQDDHNGENFVPPGQQQQQQYYPRDYSSERREPPPAHLPPPLDQPPSYRQERRIKEEPGLDMSQWSHPSYHPSPYYRKMAPPSPGNFPPAPPFSLDANEAMKVERKRARNRIAASKCRCDHAFK